MGADRAGRRAKKRRRVVRRCLGDTHTPPLCGRLVCCVLTGFRPYTLKVSSISM